MSELEKRAAIIVSQRMGLAVFQTALREEGEVHAKEELYIVTTGYTDAELGRMFRQLLGEVGARDDE